MLQLRSDFVACVVLKFDPVVFDKCNEIKIMTHDHSLSAVSESIFSSATSGYAIGALGAPTPPPGSPYSPLQLEILSSSYSNHHQTNSILIEQPNLTSLNLKKIQEESRSRLDTKRDDAPLRSDTRRKTPSPGRTSSSQHAPLAEGAPPPPPMSNGGCSRTNPIPWPMAALQVQVKREPQTCHQVGDVPIMATSSGLAMGAAGSTMLSTGHMLPAGTVVKIEQSSPTGCLQAKQHHQPGNDMTTSVHQSTIASLSTSSTNSNFLVHFSLFADTFALACLLKYVELI